MSSYADRIGVSTLCLGGMTLEEGIDRTLDVGFSAFEITPITYGGPEVFSEDDRANLREKLSAFHVVTVHSSGMGNICSDDSAERDLSRTRYEDLLGFGEAVGAKAVTFHPGRSLDGSTEEAARTGNVAFGRSLVQRADLSFLKLGYELFDQTVAAEIGSGDFGVLFDIGHASRLNMDMDTDDVLKLIEGLSEQVVQFHVHGVGGSSKRDHLPFAENRWLDYDRIIPRIAPMQVPHILEIGIRSDNGMQNLRDCAAAKEAMLAAAEGG